ncbi:hypothetical protein RN001_010146 [Aquatica leii]|uniref:NodB homology domain-containing protein n=1 Tax=Aquatica leii TaxID=1421715 RepID=A0AAN7Q306_9COLE|nr:hypothetical protein RN001_010146 [Aquatica leii]
MLGFYAFNNEVESCNVTVCTLPNCLCASSNPPINLKPSEIPQLVMLTFDDAVNILNFNYYTQLFDNRKNPDNCSISTMYFIQHEYTDYKYVHQLWSRGHEISLHSITHQVPNYYWQTLSVDGLKREFADQIKLIAKFAKIPTKDIQGMRLPFLQLSGDNSFKMINESGLKYDCSWSTRAYIDSGLFPYTLDYKSPQDCPIGPCPTTPIPGVWVVPMVNWRDALGYPCAMVDGCYSLPSDENKLLDLIKQNFHRHYNGTRSPFGFYMHASWFQNVINLNAYKRFLDYLQGFQNVYLVSVQKALEWMQNPKPLNKLNSQWSCTGFKPDTCVPKSCRLMKDSSERYMTICDSTCPRVYPWIGNPLGV